MRTTASTKTILAAILKKDLKAYARNKVYVFMTVLSLFFFALFFYIIPDTVDETITLAVSPPLKTLVEEGKEALRRLGLPSGQLDQLDPGDLEGEEGLKLVGLETREQLQQVVEGRQELYRLPDGSLFLRDLEAGEKKPRDGKRIRLDIGISFPRNFIADTALNRKSTVTVYSRAVVPQEIRHAMQSFVRELAYQIAGKELPVEFPDEESIILGRDRMGDQPSLRDKMRPMLAFFMLMVETFAMAALISMEVLQRTVTALMVTPMRVWHFLAAKTIFGTGLAFSQGMLILALVGSFTPANWSLLMATIFIGAVLFTSVAMVIGAAGKDFFDQLMYSMLFIIPLMIPVFTVLFPGTAAAWVRFIPSYPIIHLIVGTTIYDAGWQESLAELAYALAWVAVLYGAGLYVLKRKVEAI